MSGPENPEESKKPFIGSEKVHKLQQKNESTMKEFETMLEEEKEIFSFLMSCIENTNHHIEFLETKILDWEHKNPGETKHLKVLTDDQARSKTKLIEYEEWKKQTNDFITELELSKIKTSMTEDELNDLQTRHKLLMMKRKP